MKKINWKVRIKNKLFWLTFIPALATTVFSILDMFGIVPAISEESVVNAGGAVVSILVTLGVLIDPTTKGVSDSENALTYTEPK